MSRPPQPDAAGAERVAELFGERPMEAPRLRAALRPVLSGASMSISDLVHRSGLSRRLVLDLLRGMGSDLAWNGETVRFVAAAARYGPLTAADVGAVTDAAIERMRRILDRAPPPIHGLDHVPATAETVLRRAAYVAERFDLGRTRLLFAGDHDCTSLAFAVLGLTPRSATVVDIDERLLAFLAAEAAGLGAPISALFADLRLALPVCARGAHDVAITDPPYTPDGVGLFVARAVEGLQDPPGGRVLLAYGYSESTPALGLKVQRSLGELDLLFEEIVTGFNRYDGAEAIGSRADLYRLRPTRRTARIAQRTTARYTRNLYTQGRQAEESEPGDRDDGVRRAVLGRFGDGTPPLLVGDGWSPGALPVERFLTDGGPAASPGTAIIDLRPSFGWSLVRAGLLAGGDRTIVIAPGDAYGLRSRAEQTSLRDALAPKHSVERLLRGFEGTDATVVVLRRASGGPVAAYVWERPHGRLANTWREGLIAAARAQGRTLTKNQARALIDRADVPAHATGHRLIDLPAAALARLLGAIDDTTKLI